MTFTINPNKAKSDPTPFGQSLNHQNTKKSTSKNEQQHLADVYATFVKSFDGPSDHNNCNTTNFVHGGSLDPNNNKQTPLNPEKPKHYTPTSNLFKPPTAAAILASRKLTARDLARLKKEQQKSTSLRKKKGGARQIHLLFEEMKARQQRDQIMDDRSYDAPKNNEDELLPNIANTAHANNLEYNASTNLYVGNLPLNICETELIEIFGRYGIIGSVKIMWPRTEQEHARDRLCGFVSYIRRCDAEMALNELKDNHLFGERLRLGWGKPVVAANCNKEEEETTNIYQVPPTATRYVIKLPQDEVLRAVIDRTAFYVAQYGEMFEVRIMEKEVKRDKNEKFMFLVSNDDINKYYRWRVYSISMGDSLYKWRNVPFQILQNGPYWIPPANNNRNKLQVENDIFFMRNKGKKRVRSKQHTMNMMQSMNNMNMLQNQQMTSTKDRTRLTSRPLSDRDRTQFMTMLRALNCKRFKIKEAMIFCLDHSEFGKEVCEILSEALTLNETTFHKKLARLFLVSDVLCNCNTAKKKNASLYRIEFKNNHLLKIFKSLHCLLINDSANNKDRKMMKEKVLKVIKVWDKAVIFPSFFTSQLKQLFIYGEIMKKSNFKSKHMATKKKKSNDNMNQSDIAFAEAEQRKINKEKNKNLVYPPHAKLFIAKKTNNPNKAFTSYSFAKLTKQNVTESEDLCIDRKTNVFTKLMQNNNNGQICDNENKNGNNGFNMDKMRNINPGKYDGEPLPIDECIDIELL